MDQHNPSNNPRRLHRSKDQRMLLGVCGGLAEHFDMDPTLMRIIFVAGSLLFGSGLLVYIVLAVIMPAQSSVAADPRAATRETLDEAVDEVKKGVDLVSDKVRSFAGKSKNNTDQF